MAPVMNSLGNSNSGGEVIKVDIQKTVGSFSYDFGGTRGENHGSKRTWVSQRGKEKNGSIQVSDETGPRLRGTLGKRLIFQKGINRFDTAWPVHDV